MRATESISVEITGTQDKWVGKVIAIGSPATTEAAAREAAVSLNKDGFVAVYNAVSFSDSGTLSDQIAIVEEKAAQRDSKPENIAARITSAEASVEATEKELVKAEEKARAMVALAKAAKAAAAKSLKKRLKKPGRLRSEIRHNRRPCKESNVDGKRRIRKRIA